MTPHEHDFALPLDTPPMEARSAEAIPDGDAAWQYEPKWDGFRCLAFKAADAVELRAKSGKPLGRYFPEVVALLREVAATDFVIDGELVIELGGHLAFDALQMRLHPAASRIRKLAAETPARLMLFDMLAAPGGASLIEAPLSRRRAALEAFVAQAGVAGRLMISPCTRDRDAAARWLGEAGQGATDGVIAKRVDGAYVPGERAMVKVKRLRTADCVVGGFRYESNSRAVGSLLLGLYDDAGKLDHVGFTSTIADAERAGADPQAGGVARGARLHRQRTGWPEPVEHGAQRRLGTAAAGAGGGGALRPCHRRPLPARHQAAALAPRQGAAAMHDGADRAAGGGRDGAVARLITPACRRRW